MLGPTAHVDTFTRDNLPPLERWPQLDLSREAYQYPEYLNAGVELTDRLVEQGFGDRIALKSDTEAISYRDLSALTNRIAQVLVEDLKVVPGERVLIRSANNPRMVACWLAVMKAGAVAVNTMPLLRAVELTKVVDKAEIRVALCDRRLEEEMHLCAAASPFLKKVVYFDGTGTGADDLERRLAGKDPAFAPVRTGRDDVALLGFTSGTTGAPKATMHFHRDILIIADGYAQEVLNPQPEDVFIGSPPLAFTFGLGGLVVFPLRFGATACLVEDARPASLLASIQRHQATLVFTAPTAYRVILATLQQQGSTDAVASLRAAVSAGETLPPSICQMWMERTGKPILDGIGATEMLHIFISNRFGEIRPGSTGRAVPGYTAMIVDDAMTPLPPGSVGKLAVRGPTGCRYMADDRQGTYVRDGWNLTGDAFRMDEDGYFWFAARTDDMIVSAGYNIAGPEVEDALLTHPDVAECAVIGVEDEDRGQIVQAHVVLKDGTGAGPEKVRELQDYVKSRIAPYKYPRSIVFTDALPKTATGKIQRFRLRDAAA
ncbi:benzoate-CoA ligase family protein [Novispirillum itersonii]|uniref:2-aminobenzoate-CoA ligase n=1 Tax=Novispirillum itersonii TaxID=189 RepID=A0A7W9ZIN7_NOVIT|nr:benzoate-CoA ligase family protein [Novispirillum itersonii]MBB6210974.1 2-aminobenzoate-CoA ligase [Novispirillum itersonii]